jgi:hypothetical protein
MKVLFLTSLIIFGTGQVTATSNLKGLKGHRSLAVTGTCMGDDAYNGGQKVLSKDVVSGCNSPDCLNCSAGDNSASASVVVGSAPATCTVGGTVAVRLEADFVSGAGSARSDVGVWVALTEDSSAQKSGTCAHFHFLQGDSPGDGQLPQLGDNKKVTEDLCGDNGGQTSLFGVPLVTPQVEIAIPCVANSDGFVEIDVCFSWKTPGQETNCPLDSDFRLGTVPGAVSKCSCTPVVTDILVVEEEDLDALVFPRAGTDVSDTPDVMCG